ncbi:MAG TPA: hypothetical protein VF103_05175 [Polyangiaceae bacterium]
MRVSLFLALVVLGCTFGCGGAEPRPEEPRRKAPSVSNGAVPPSVADADRGAALAHIAAERTERGRSPVKVIDDAPPLEEAAALLRDGATPEKAIRTALERVAELESSDASGWCVPGTSPGDFEVPSEVLERREVTLALVAVRKPPSAPPPTFVVCLLVLEDGSDFGGHGPVD